MNYFSDKRLRLKGQVFACPFFFLYSGFFVLYHKKQTEIAFCQIYRTLLQKTVLTRLRQGKYGKTIKITHKIL